MIGQQIDNYEVKSELGQGGMAIVYRALDVHLERDVALKVLHEHIAAQDENRERFVREAKAVARLQHPNIIQIYGFSAETSSVGYIAAELVEGPTLRDFVDNTGMEYPEIACALGVLVARALHHAHETGVIHRDLKPENVMITDRGVPKLMDFGLARLLDAQTVTVTGSLLGSPAHMAPEIIEGARIDRRVDIFAFGTLLYVATTGQLPFEGSNPATVLNAILNGKYIPASAVNPQISREVEAVIDRCLATDPDDRFDSAADVGDALLDAIRPFGITRPEESFAAFYKDPEAWNLAFRPVVLETLETRARAALARGRKGWPEAFNICDRMMQIEPDNAAAQDIVSRANRRRKVTRAGVLGGAALAVAVLSLVALALWNAAGDRHAERFYADIERVSDIYDATLAQARSAAGPSRNIAAGIIVSYDAVAATEEMHSHASELTREILWSGPGAEARNDFYHALATAGRAAHRAYGRLDAEREIPVLVVSVGESDDTDAGSGAATEVDEVADTTPTHPVSVRLFPPAVELTVDGTVVPCRGGSCTLQLREGRRRLVARHPETGREEARSLNVSAGTNDVRIAVPWPDARLVVLAPQPGTVLFNNRRVGSTGSTISIPIEGSGRTMAGTVRVLPSDSFGRPAEFTVTLTGGATTRERVDFR